MRNTLVIIIFLNIFTPSPLTGQIVNLESKKFTTKIPSPKKLRKQREKTGCWQVVKNDGEISAQFKKYIYTEFRGDSIPFIPSQCLTEYKDQNDKIHTILYPYPWQNNTKTVKTVDDGYLVIYNSGRWGCSICWVSKNDKDSTYMVSYGSNIYDIVEYKDILLVRNFGGSTNDGQLIELYKDNNKWTTRPFLELLEAPRHVYITENNEILIVGLEKIVLVGENKQLTVTLDNSFWAYADHPSSIISKDEFIYVGFSRGVLKLNRNNPEKIQWIKLHRFFH